MLLVWIYISSVTFALIIGLVLFKRSAGWELFDRLIAALVPIALIALIGDSLSLILYTPFSGWNAARLAQGYSLVYGYQMYYPAEIGPVIASNYGPVSAYLYLPTTIAKSPTIAIIIAVLINLLVILPSVLWLIFSKNFGNRHKLLFACAGFLCFGLLAMRSQAFRNAIFFHIDGHALGFALAACAVLYLRKERDNLAVFILSALLISMAIWVKLTIMPLVIALPFYILLVDGRKACVQFSLTILVVLSLVSGMFFAVLGFQETIFNMVKVQAVYPYKNLLCSPSNPCTGLDLLEDKFEAVLLYGKEFLDEIYFLAAIVISYALYKLYFAHSDESTPTKFLQRLKPFVSANPWSLLLMIAILMAPGALAARWKEGGDTNQASLINFFLLVATAIILIEAAFDTSSRYASIIAKVAKSLIIVLLISLTCLELPLPRYLYQRWKFLPSNPEQMAYEYALKYPDQIYFPGHSLASLMADKKLYHCWHGFDARRYVQPKISDEQFRAHIPANIRMVAYYPTDTREFMEYLPEFSKQIRLDELPGWIVYVRE